KPFLIYFLKNSDGDTVLHIAIIKKQVEIVEYLKDENLWNVANKEGKTPLMLALEKLDEKVFLCVKSILPCKAVVRLYRGADNITLLHAAVLKGSVRLVQVLLREFDIDSGWADKFGNTAIYYAVQKKHFELVKILMDANVSLTGPSGLPSMPPFVAAVLWNQLNIIKLYLQIEAGAAIKLKEHCADGRNLVISSTIQNNFEICKLLLECVGFDLNVGYENGFTALHAAAAGSSVRMVALLLQHGAHIDQSNYDGKTALLMAIENGNWRVAHYLLSKGASKQVVTDYHYKGDQGMNVLHSVAVKGELDSIKFLLDRDFFEQSVTDAMGKTMGHYAASNKQHDVVEYLISTNFPLDLLDNEGKSPLVCALENEDLQLAKRLKSIGASLDVVQQFDQRHSLLVQAVAEKKTDLAKFIIDECFLETSVALDNILISLDQIALDGGCVKPLVNTNESQISTSRLIQHLLEGNRTLAETLIDDEASLEELRNFRLPTKDQETVLHVVSRNGLTSCLNLLLEKAVFQVDVGDIDQTTALQEAAMYGQLECVKLLLQYDANVNFVDLQNTTALTRAIFNSKKEVAIFLLDLGVKVDNTISFRVASSDDSSVLHVVDYQDVGLVELLVNRVGIDVNVRDNSGRTALHYAALMRTIQPVEELLKLSANPDLIDHHQRTPFVAALLSGHIDTAERLLTATSDREYLRNFRMSGSQKSILHIALDKGSIGLFMRLLNDYKLDCSCVDLNGKSVLHYAVATGNATLIEQLRFNPDLLFAKDNFGESPLSICLLQSNLKVFFALIQSLTTVDPLISVFKQVLQLNPTQFTKNYSRWLLNNRKCWFAGNERFIDLIKKSYDSNPLESAILRNDKELIELFLECGFERSFLQDRVFLNTTTWLHIAAIKNYHLLVKVILDEFQIPVDSTDNHQQTPLSYAVVMRHTETAAALLKYGANANYQDSKKRTPLQSALENNHKEMVQLLLDNNANISLLQEFRYENDNQHLVQHYLVERGLVDMLNFIISDIDLNHCDKHGMTSLHYAAGCNQLEMIDILVIAGATVDCTDKHGSTPLMRALSKGHLDAYRKLLGYGASIDLVKEFRNNAYDGETLLHITAEKDRIAPTKLLIEELECDVDCVDKNGNTPLHCAIQKGCFEVVKYLLAKNANLQLRNGADQTAMQMLEATDNDLASGVPPSADEG
ncbi:serine/threonine-protein phosphatase 6 regulatory ankyrin repeat subunit B-like, partial [Ochlerotatus camptorhynchus]|uniref:serine/threonine-protein phosphatase 6 regulatory ankyrin repeat subunit B-like n=1 Tax=Ochlerotatus camptorhynchus TaxID=644619 RepID=UPI0031E2CFDF